MAKTKDLDKIKLNDLFTRFSLITLVTFIAASIILLTQLDTPSEVPFGHAADTLNMIAKLEATIFGFMIVGFIFFAGRYSDYMKARKITKIYLQTAHKVDDSLNAEELSHRITKMKSILKRIFDVFLFNIIVIAFIMVSITILTANIDPSQSYVDGMLIELSFILFLSSVILVIISLLLLHGLVRRFSDVIIGEETIHLIGSGAIPHNLEEQENQK